MHEPSGAECELVIMGTCLRYSILCDALSSNAGCTVFFLTAVAGHICHGRLRLVPDREGVHYFVLLVMIAATGFLPFLAQLGFERKGL